MTTNTTYINWKDMISKPKNNSLKNKSISSVAINKSTHRNRLYAYLVIGLLLFAFLTFAFFKLNGSDTSILGKGAFAITSVLDSNLDYNSKSNLNQEGNNNLESSGIESKQKTPFLSTKNNDLNKERESLVVTFNYTDIDLYTKDQLTKVNLNNLPDYSIEGKPVIPTQPLEILLPKGKIIEDYEIIFEEKVQVIGTYDLEFGSKIIPLLSTEELTANGFDLNNSIKDEDTYNLEIYPPIKNTIPMIQDKTGYSFAIFNLFPVNYSPKNKTISYYKDITIKLYLKDGPVSTAYRSSLSDYSKIKEMLDLERIDPISFKPLNKQDSEYQIKEDVLSTYYPSSGSSRDGNGACQYLIITTQEFVSAFQEIANLKSTREINPITSCVYSVEEIISNQDYSCTGEWNWNDGCGTNNQLNDTQAKIRNFIRYSYSAQGTEYVLLGGDSDYKVVGGDTQVPIVPVRYFGPMDMPSLMPMIIASDMYYSNLNGSFNIDNDNNFLESNEDATLSDLYSEVYVGRLPVDSILEINNFTNKLEFMQSGNVPILPYMVGEYLGFGGESDYATETLDEIRFGSNDSGYSTTGFIPSFDQTQVGTLYDDANVTWTKNQLFNLINGGTNLINHLGHSNTQYVMRLYNSDVNDLNNIYPLFIYTQGCFPGSFDNYNSNLITESADSISEQLLFKESPSGGFSEIMNNRYGFGKFNSTDGPSQWFARWFWDGAFNSMISIKSIGKLNSYSHEKNNWRLSNQFEENNYARYIYTETNLLGDPEYVFVFNDLEVNSKLEMQVSDNVKQDNNLDVNFILSNTGINDLNNLVLNVYFEDNLIFTDNIPSLISGQQIIVNHILDTFLYFDLLGSHFNLNAELIYVGDELVFDNFTDKNIWVYNVSEGFVIQNKSNYIFDCATTQNPLGRPIDLIVGPGKASNVFLISLIYSNNVIIKNCNCSGSLYGVYFSGSDNNISLLNNSFNNVMAPIRINLSMTQVSNLTLKNNTFDNCYVIPIHHTNKFEFTNNIINVEYDSTILTFTGLNISGGSGVYTISDNNFHGRSIENLNVLYDAQLSIYNSNGNTTFINNNRFLYGVRPILIDSSSNITFSNNYIEYFGAGVKIDSYLNNSQFINNKIINIEMPISNYTYQKSGFAIKAGLSNVLFKDNYIEVVSNGFIFEKDPSKAYLKSVELNNNIIVQSPIVEYGVTAYKGINLLLNGIDVNTFKLIENLSCKYGGFADLYHNVNTFSTKILPYSYNNHFNSVSPEVNSSSFYCGCEKYYDGNTCVLRDYNLSTNLIANGIYDPNALVNFAVVNSNNLPQASCEWYSFFPLNKFASDCNFWASPVDLGLDYGDVNLVVKIFDYNTKFVKYIPVSIILGDDYNQRVSDIVSNPAPGIYTGSVLVDLNTLTQNAIIRYTLDGSQPTISSLEYINPILVDHNLTLKARAYKSGMLDSNVFSGDYIIVYPTVAKPIANPGTGSYVNSVSVSLSTSTPNAIIRYTRNGTEPNASSQVYTSPININNTSNTNPVILKAKAYKSGMNPSQVSTNSYTLTSIVETPVSKPSPGSYKEQVVVSLFTTTVGATIRYTLDGSQPTESSTKYVSEITIKNTTTLKAKAFKSGTSSSKVFKGIFKITYG